MIGCLFGILATYPAAAAFGAELSMFFPVFNVTPETVYMDIGAALIVGTVAGIFPAWRSIRIRIADGLRRIG
jgi:putative ABC transport system permease protein